MGTRIYSEYIGYGINDVIDNLVWLGDNTMAFSLRDGIMNICGNSVDLEEVKSFIKVISPSVISCSLELAEKLDLRIIEQGEILTKEIPLPKNEILRQYDIDLTDFSKLLEQSQVFDKESFRLNFSYALNHNFGTGVSIYDGEKVIACGLSLNITDNSFIITAVSTDKHYQRQGYGSEIIRQIEKKATGRRGFLFKEYNKNNEFYKKLGYTYFDKWANCKIK